MTNNTDGAALLPCPRPWCRDSKPALMQGGFRNRTFVVECETCGTRGPAKDDIQGAGAAITAWNTRTQQTARSADGGRDALACGTSNEDIAKLRELLEYTERHLPKIPWRVIPSDGKPIIAGRPGSGNLFRGYIATWKEADLACLAVNTMPSLLDELAMLRSIVSAALKYRTAGGMRKALEPALFAAKAAFEAEAALTPPTCSTCGATERVSEGLNVCSNGFHAPPTDEPVQKVHELPTDEPLQGGGLREENERLRAGLEKIVRTWTFNKRKAEDEWEDGYEDALAECARLARLTLSRGKP